MLKENNEKIRRIRSLDRRQLYDTPTPCDVLCPYFDGTFIKTGTANVTNTFAASCNDQTDETTCEYKEILIDLPMCKRYWADDPLNMELIKKIPDPPPYYWQLGDVKFNYAREFRDRVANVELSLIHEVKTHVSLGDFLTDWSSVSESELGNWSQVWNESASRYEILNKKNQSGRSFWYNPIHSSSEDYTHQYYVQARGADDDMYGSVFRYANNSFYSFEWDSGGLDVNGLGIYKTVNGTRTRLTGYNIKWGANRSYIHRVTIRAVKNRITVTVERQSGSGFTTLVHFTHIDNIDPLLYGAWGPMTDSQPDTFFWGMAHMALISLKDQFSLLKKEIPLEYISNTDGVHVVSKAIETYFPQEEIDLIASDNGYTDVGTLLPEYYIYYTNVTEGVIFDKTEGNAYIATSGDSKVAMRSFNYNGNILPFSQSISVTDRTISYKVTDTIYIDKQLISIEANASYLRYFDNIRFLYNEKEIAIVPNVTPNKIEFLFDIQLEVGDTIQMVYVPNLFELEYYKGDYVDTHDKIFKIEGNKLYWHMID